MCIFIDPKTIGWYFQQMWHTGWDTVRKGKTACITIVLVLLIVVVLTIVALLLLIAWRAGLPSGDVFSLGQLCVDALLLPVTLIAFFMAMQEFRKTQATPNLDLHWQSEVGETAKECVVRMPASGLTDQKRLVLSNNGDAVSTWYLVKIQIPWELVDYLEVSTLGLTGPMRDVPHDQVGNWQVFQDNEEVRCEFMSAGQVALFPGVTQFLANLLFVLNPRYLHDYWPRLKYTIMADQMQRKDGTLTIQIRPEETEKTQVAENNGQTQITPTP